LAEPLNREHFEREAAKGKYAEGMGDVWLESF
jgi:hypothetical protein